MEAPSLLSSSSRSEPDPEPLSSLFIGRVSVSESLEAPSSSELHTHSPVTVRCNRPDAPGCLFDAYNTKYLLCFNFSISPLV